MAEAAVLPRQRAAAPVAGQTQPYTSVRIWAPIQSWNGLPTGRLVGLVAVEEVAVGDPLGGEHRLAGQQFEPGEGDVVGGQGVAVALDEGQGEQGEVEVVVLGHPGDVLDEAGRAAGRFHG